MKNCIIKLLYRTNFRKSSCTIYAN